MSQAGILNLAAGPVPPSVPENFTTDDGNAIPVANNLNVLGRSTNINDTDGIRTNADPDGSDNLYIEITNRLQGTGQTIDVGTDDIITFTPSTIGVYAIELRIGAFNTTSTLGAGYSLFGAVRYDGVNSNICDPFDAIDNEEGTMSSTGLDIVVSGADIILRAQGYAGQTINWSAVALYTFVGA